MRKIIFSFFLGFAFVFFACNDEETKSYVERLLHCVQDEKADTETRVSCLGKIRQHWTGFPKDMQSVDRLIVDSYNLQDTESFYFFSHQFLRMASSKHDTLNVSKGYEYLGIFHSEASFSDSALYYFNRALKHSKNARHPDLYLNVASIYYDLGNFHESEKYAIKAMEVYEKPPRPIAYRSCVLLANISANFGDYDMSFQKMAEAIEIIENDKDLQLSFSRETLWNNIGVNYQNIGKHHEALKFFDKGINSVGIEDDDQLYATLLDNIAYSRLKLGEVESVESLFRKALNLRIAKRNTPKIVLSLLHLGELEVARGSIEKGLASFQKGYQISSKYDLMDEKVWTLKQLINFDKPNQHKYIQEYIKISDSLKTVERRNHNKFARIAFETDEIIKQKEEAELTERIYAGSALAFIVVMSLTFTTLYQRSKNKKLQLHKIQQEADAEIMKLLTVHQEEIAMAREDEKKRIGRELHDGVMNRLAGARIQLEKLAESQDDETIRKCLAHISQLHSIESDLRAVSHDLSRDNDVTYLHFSNMLSTMVAQLAGDRENYITSKIKFNDWKSLSSTFKIGIYRILQEALGNCIKHSGADQIKLAITSKDNELRITVTDNGKGFQMDLEPDGIGLKNIKIRVRELNGKISITSEPGVGTTLSLAFSLKDHQEASQSKS